MDKSQLTKSDIITKFILPAVKNAGWDIMFTNIFIGIKMIGCGIQLDITLFRK